MTSKQDLHAELVRLLSADLAAAERAQGATLEGVTHEEARPENDKDTRALEQSYLARGQARRVEELRAELAQTRAMPVGAFPDGSVVTLGALVVAEEEAGEGERERTFFLAPGRGGTTLSGGIAVVTPGSPLGRALLGKRSGDDCELSAAGRVRRLSILAIE